MSIPGFDPTAGANNVGAIATQGSAPVGPTGYLSVEELILFVEGSVADIDAQIRNRMADIESRKKLAQKYQEFATAIRDAKNKNGADADQMAVDLVAKAKEMQNEGFGTEALTIAQQVLAGQMEKNSSEVDQDWLEGKAKQFDDLASSLTSTVELDMIRLQKDIQMRTQAITFVSNTMAALREADKTAINNIRG